MLDAYGRLAARRGLTWAYLDGRDVELTADAVLGAIAERGLRQGRADGQVDLLLIDGYELLAPLDAWFRQELLPGRPAGAVTVLAGRSTPSREWRLDPGWRRVASVHEVPPLDPDQSRHLLGRLGVDAVDSDPLSQLGRGHPLALAMLAEAAADGRVPADLIEAPAVAAALCHRLINDVPDEAHRTGLATCAHAVRMTEDLLARTVGARAPEVWAWLEARPYVRRGEVGLFVHDVVREAFEAEMAVRSPEAYATLHVTVRDYFFQRLFDPHEPRPDRAAAELLLLHRRGPLADHLSVLRDAGRLSVIRATPTDADGIVALVEEAEGARVAALARRWITIRPRGLLMLRSDDGVDAFALQIYAPAGAADPGLDADDPVVAAILAHVEREGPLRPGERVNVNRFAGASLRYQRDPAVLLVNGISCILEWALEAAAWTFMVTVDADLYGRTSSTSACHPSSTSWWTASPRRPTAGTVVGSPPPTCSS